MPDLKEKRVELILQQLEDLPTLPGIAVRVLEATGRDESSAADVIKLIQSDQSLTARVLQLAHRADTGIRSDVNTVDRAVVLLGFAAVRNAVLAISVFETFRPGTQTKSPFNREEFWKHSIAVAAAAELLASETHGSRDAIDPSEAFVCGLLHDLGKVALDATLPKSFARVVEATDLLRGNIADLERTIIGLDHMVVGKRLAETWNLPTLIRDCIWLHGQLPQALPASVRNPRMVNLITLADAIVREQHLGYSGNYLFPASLINLAQIAGISEAQLDIVMARLVDHIEPRAKSLGLGQSTTSELYQQALSQANKELGRVSGQLAVKNRKLQVRAKFFDALAGFQAEIRPDAPPLMVLHAIGQTAVASIDAMNLAVFSLPQGRDYAETIFVDKSGDVTEQTIVEIQNAQSLQLPAGSDGPVMSAGAEMEWLLASVSPKLTSTHRYWIRLEADGSCIGGVMWGAPIGEAARLAAQVRELTALASGWSLALRTAQIREEARSLSEQLAEANRQLQNAQSEIMRSRMLITVGEMAAGAAHEMNNPLAVISGRSQLLASQLSDAKQKASATQIFEQSHRLSEIITELMEFAKPVPAQFKNAVLQEIVDQAVIEAKALAEATDRIIDVTFADVPDVSVDPKQVIAALAELIANAIQATAEQGEVSVHGAFDPYSRKIVLNVADNGAGMDEITLKRAFDPFFSGKKAGRRRGMGLPKALRWVESSGGSIRLESRPGQGTRAIVLLPASQTIRAVEPEPPVARKQA